MRNLYERWPVRRRSVAHLLKELDAAVAEGPPVVYVDLIDDVFLTADLPYLEKFCSEYRHRIHRPFIAKTTPRYLSPEKMDLLIQAGLGWMNMGLQTASHRVCQEVYKRTVSKEAFLDAARLINQYPVAVYYDIITDNPFETVEETLETVETLTETPRPYYPLLFSMTLYPGTELRDRAMTECPERCDEGLTKDFLKLDYRPVNDLLELAPFLHRPLMRRLIVRFRRAPESLTTRAAIAIAKAYCQLFLGPLAYIRLIRRSQHGSWIGTFRALPVYMDRGLRFYFRRFKWFKRHAKTGT